MTKYNQFYELGIKIDKAMENIKKLNYGDYSLTKCLEEEREVYHILSNMIEWQCSVNKGIWIYGNNKYQVLRVYDIEKENKEIGALSYGEI